LNTYNLCETLTCVNVAVRAIKHYRRNAPAKHGSGDVVLALSWRNKDSFRVRRSRGRLRGLPPWTRPKEESVGSSRAKGARRFTQHCKLTHLSLSSCLDRSSVAIAFRQIKYKCFFFCSKTRPRHQHIEFLRNSTYLVKVVQLMLTS
jgi:hypothetical protein